MFLTSSWHGVCVALFTRLCHWSLRTCEKEFRSFYLLILHSKFTYLSIKKFTVILFAPSFWYIYFFANEAYHNIVLKRWQDYVWSSSAVDVADNQNGSDFQMKRGASCGRWHKIKFPFKIRIILKFLFVIECACWSVFRTGMTKIQFGTWKFANLYLISYFYMSIALRCLKQKTRLSSVFAVAFVVMFHF